MSPLRFQTCRLLSGNVRNRELTIIQRRILRRLRNRKRSIKKRKISRSSQIAPALLGAVYFFILFLLPRILFCVRLAYSFLSLIVDASLFVLPNLDLPPDTGGNQIVLNPDPVRSLEAFYNEIESSANLQARNLELLESWERVQGMERALENEGDPGRRAQLSARLDQEIEGLRRQLHLGQRADSIRDWQIAEWKRRYRTELSHLTTANERRRFDNFCMKLEICLRDDQAPQN